ncbi:MAG: hypothetical protein LLF95_07750 [Bacteroidales bacterium]|nr:hypothetical protein [Bacteroidales bacterium]
MKKIILTLAFVVSMIGAVSAQVDGKALGLRFGGVSGLGAEISYQHPLSDANRLELDLGLNKWGAGLSGIYQWVWDLSALSDGFNWYAGVGGTLGLSDSSFGIGVIGQVGIEFNFNIPLQLSLDYRPAIYILPSFAGGYDGICLSARYKF